MLVLKVELFFISMMVLAVPVIRKKLRKGKAIICRPCWVSPTATGTQLRNKTPGLKEKPAVTSAETDEKKNA